MPNKVYEQLKNEILLLDIKPGEMLSEIELSNRFKVSRTPIRDALIRLQNEGLIEVRPHIGTFVTLIDFDLITDVIYMREKLEKAIIGDLIENPNQLVHLSLKLSVEAQKKIIESDLNANEKAKRFMEMDNEFHKFIFKMNNKENVWNYLDNIRTHYDRLRMFLNDDSPETLNRLYYEHMEIVESIISGKKEDAFNIYDKHLYYGIQQGAEMILNHKHYFKELKDLI